MDILTPKGQQSKKHETIAANIFCKEFPDITYIETPKDKPAKIDALLFSHGEIIRAVETKCRNTTLDEFRNSFKNEWLITFEKVDSCRLLSAALGVPLVGFLYLIPSNVLMVVQISDERGIFTQKIRIEATKTQQTINGGTAVRNNAYIEMNNSHLIFG